MIKLIMRPKYSRKRISLRYAPNRGTNIFLATPFTIDPDSWDPVNQQYDLKLKKRIPKTDLDKKKNEYIDNFNLKLEEFSVDVKSFITNSETLDSRTLKEFIARRSNVTPKKIQTSVKKSYAAPILFSDFVNYYIDNHSKNIIGSQKPIKIRTIQKYQEIRKKLQRIYPKLRMDELNDKFREHFSNWCLEQKYTHNYIVKNLEFIKIFARYGKNMGLPISNEVLNWKLVDQQKNYHEPTLSTGELEALRNLQFVDSKLEVARDWLLIGCACGQRISDFLRFNNDNIVDAEFLEFTQKKTNLNIVIPMFDEIKQMIKKYGGFPPSIPDQKFNKSIKEICRLANINEMIEGGKMIGKRKVFAKFEKWELITSHICRRSFVSNYRSILGDEVIYSITGHSNVKMLNLYDQRSPKIKAMAIKEKIDQKFQA